MHRLGIFGGTFDPPHHGHLVAAVHARDAFALDEVLLVVAHDPWQKRGSRSITPGEQRLAMVDAAIEAIDGLSASDIELRRGGPSFTIDTVEELCGPKEPKEAASTECVLVVGADVVNGLDTWHRADELRDRVEVAALHRPGSSLDPPPGWRVTEVPIPLIGISSTMLRSRAAAGGSLDALTPPAVVNYIDRHDLYSR